MQLAAVQQNVVRPLSRISAAETGFGINLNPMVSHRCANLLARSLGDDHVGRLNGHMAIDAIRFDLFSHRLCHSAALPLMTRETTIGIACRNSFRRVNVMTGRASHGLRGPETAAPLQ